MVRTAQDVRRAPEGAGAFGLMGRGALYEATSRRLMRGHHRVEPFEVEDFDAAAARCFAILMVSDGWDRQLEVEVNDRSLKNGVPWLRAHIEPGSAIVGPCVFRGESGCVVCAETRRLIVREDAKDYSELLERRREELASPGRSWLTKFGIEVLAGLLVDEAEGVSEGPGGMRTRNSVVRLELDGLRSSVHRFLPDPLCPHCGSLQDDSAEAARIVVGSRPKLSPNSYRIRSLAAEEDRIVGLYVDSETGLVRGMNKGGRGIFPTTSAPMGFRGGFGIEVGFGRKLDYQASRLTAVTEALERYGGIQAGGKRTVVRGSYEQLGEDALDPTTLGLPSEEQYELTDYPFARYRHDLSFNWVWGYSFGRQAPILVPETYAYYQALYKGTKDRPFLYEISNGCALGGCLEEAVLYGILEVAERDAFLMTWHAQLGVPRLDPFSVRNRSVPLMVERIEHLTGYAVRVFNTTLEQGIPCVWALAVDESDRPGHPKALCTAGGHLDPEKALEGALLELAPFIGQMGSLYRENRNLALKMLRDPYLVRRMGDHALLNCTPEAFERSAFLRDGPRRQTFEEAFPDFYGRPGRKDLLEDLNDALTRYLDAGLDVVVVEQTTPEHAGGNLTCVKVIIPGTLPMTFGHHARRLSGLERLHRVPKELGYRARPLTDADINPHPHPFP